MGLIPLAVLQHAMVLQDTLDADPMFYFNYPSKVGRDFVLFHESCAKARQARAGNQVGKSVAGVRELYWHLTGTHPFRETTHEPPVEWWIVCYSFAQSLTIQRNIWRFFPRDSFHPSVEFVDEKGFKNKCFKMRNGSIVWIKTVNQGTLGLSSATLHGIWIDEPPPPEVYNECIARLLVKNGELIITMTPVGRPTKHLQKLVEEGGLEDFQIKMIVENCPHLTQEQIDGIATRYLAKERKQRINGDWVGLADARAFEAFNHDEHVYRSRPRGKYKVALQADHGERPGTQYFGLTIFRPDRYSPFAILLDEYCPDKATTIEEDVKGVAKMLEKHGMTYRDVDFAVGDINSAGKQDVNMSLNEKFMICVAEYLVSPYCPFEIQAANKTKGSIDWGLRLLNYALLQGKFRIHANCTKAIETFSYWEGKDDEYKHCADAIRYFTTELYGEAFMYADIPKH